MRRLFTLMALAALVMSVGPVSAQVLFQDDFESGMGAWTTASACTPMDWSTAQNAVPVDGSYSAYANLSQDRIYHNLSRAVTVVRATWYIYDDGMTRAYGELRAYSGGGYGSGTLQQFYAIGKYHASGMSTTKYQGRWYVPAGQWFNLDDPGSPDRSVGWHRFDVQADGQGKVEFYVDGVLSKTRTGITPAGMNCVDLGFGTSSASNGDAWFDGVQVIEQPNRLTLTVQDRDIPTNTRYVRFGQPVMLHMDVSNLAQKVNGCQAMLGYSNYYLFAEAGSVAPGGGSWDQLIYNSWDVGNGVPGEIDTAIGVDAYGSVGTDADGTVASILLTARDKEGETWVVFRPDGADVKTTMLSDMNSNPVYPLKIDSQRIVIDGTPPSCAITSATQDSAQLLHSLGSTACAVQGAVSIVVNASDALAGFGMAPACQVRVAGQNVPVTFNGQIPWGSGNYYYTATISPSTPNGTATIIATATDRAGNVTTDTDTFSINKNQITGQVTLDSFIGASRAVTFFASGGATQAWTPVLSFSGGTASYTLTNVPAGTTGLSAVTTWNLRRRLPILLDGDGQGTADFTGASLLLGGDVNGSNSVNIQDYALLKAAWMTSDPALDVNGDNQVNLLDYSILKANWFSLGDEQ